MLSNAQIKSYKEDGVIVLRDVFSEEWLELVHNQSTLAVPIRDLCIWIIPRTPNLEATAPICGSGVRMNI